MRHTFTIAAAALAVALTAGPMAAQHRHAAPDSAQAMSQCHAMEMMHGMMMGMAMDTSLRGAMDNRMDRMQGGMQTDDHWMMNAMRFAPRNILAHQDELDLNETQAAAVRELADQRPMSRMSMAAMRPLHEQLREAFEATPPDTARIRSAFEEMAARGARMHAVRFAAAATAHALLTAEQRERLEALPHPCSMSRQDSRPSGAGHDQHHGG